MRARHRFSGATLTVVGLTAGSLGVGTGAALERTGATDVVAAGLATMSAVLVEDLGPAVLASGADRTRPDALPEGELLGAAGARAEIDGGGRASDLLDRAETELPVPLDPVLPDAPELDEVPVEPVDPDALDDEGLSQRDREAGLTSTDVPDAGSGELVVVAGSEEAPEPDRTVHTVRVEVEEGLDIDHEAFAATVMRILNDPRGWGGDGSRSFARTDGDAEFRVSLVTPGTVDELCHPLETRGLYSCGISGQAVINHMRWVRTTEEFEDRTQYREYLINHEVGHLLGHGHEQCPGEGEPAPLMQQQTVAVAPCEPNGWPFPDAG